LSLTVAALAPVVAVEQEPVSKSAGKLNRAVYRFRETGTVWFIDGTFRSARLLLDHARCGNNRIGEV